MKQSRNCFSADAINSLSPYKFVKCTVQQKCCAHLFMVRKWSPKSQRKNGMLLKNENSGVDCHLSAIRSHAQPAKRLKYQAFRLHAADTFRWWCRAVCQRTQLPGPVSPLYHYKRTALVDLLHVFNVFVANAHMHKKWFDHFWPKGNTTRNRRCRSVRLFTNLFVASNGLQR